VSFKSGEAPIPTKDPRNKEESFIFEYIGCTGT